MISGAKQPIVFFIDKQCFSAIQKIIFGFRSNPFNNKDLYFTMAILGSTE
jgi:hypothetical protein